MHQQRDAFLARRKSPQIGCPRTAAAKALTTAAAAAVAATRVGASVLLGIGSDICQAAADGLVHLSLSFAVAIVSSPSSAHGQFLVSPRKKNMVGRDLRGVPYHGE